MSTKTFNIASLSLSPILLKHKVHFLPRKLINTFFSQMVTNTALALLALLSAILQGSHLMHVIINLTLCLLSVFLPESIECNAEIELKCYNGLLEKGAIFAVKSLCKSMLIHEGGG